MENKKWKAAIIAAIMLILSIALLILLPRIYSVHEENPYQLKFAGKTLNFRADLEKAANVPTFPSEEAIRQAILSENVSKIRISYVPGEYNPLYAADSFEISYKLVIIFKQLYGTSGYLYTQNSENCLFFEKTNKTVCISSYPVPSEEAIKANASEPAIFLSASNETSVKLKENIIT